MNELVETIRGGIAAHGFKNVLESRMAEVWKLDSEGRKKQLDQVSAFAATHGWGVVFSKDGSMATFRLVHQPGSIY